MPHFICITAAADTPFVSRAADVGSGVHCIVLPQVRPPMPPAFFFVIDVSQAAVASGVLAHVCRAIRASLDRLPGGERTRVGFLTFDTALHFYNLKAGLSQPQMMARRPQSRGKGVVCEMFTLFVGLALCCNPQGFCAEQQPIVHNLCKCTQPPCFTPSKARCLRAGGGGADGAVCAAAGRPAGQPGGVARRGGGAAGLAPLHLCRQQLGAPSTVRSRLRLRFRP